MILKENISGHYCLCVQVRSEWGVETGGRRTDLAPVETTLRV